MSYTEAQKRATKKWRKNNRKKATYISSKSCSKSFIKIAELNDLLELKKDIDLQIELRKNSPEASSDALD